MSENQSNQKSNGHDDTCQFVDFGALVEIDDCVKEHGIVFVGENMQPFKLMLNIEDNEITSYVFHPVQAERPEVTQVLLRNMRGRNVSKIVRP